MDTFAKGAREIVELMVDSKSKLRDVPLNRLDSIVKCKVLVCTVLRDGDAIAPDGNFVLRETTEYSSRRRRTTSRCCLIIWA